MKREEEINIIVAKLLNDIADATGSQVENEDYPIKTTNIVLAIANELDMLINEKPVAAEKHVYKVGDKVRVIDNHQGHEFNDKELITLTEFFNEAEPHWEAKNVDGISWYLWESEFEVITADTYKVGDKVVVIDNVSEHKFHIGTLVTLTHEDTHEPRWTGKCVRGINWFLSDQEIEYQQKA